MLTDVTAVFANSFLDYLANILCFQHHDNLQTVPTTTHFTHLLNQSIIYNKNLSSIKLVTYIVVQLQNSTLVL